MKPLPHEYEIDLDGAAAGYATLSAAGLPDLTVAPPAEYDGPGDAWSPEHLLLAAVASCLLFTVRAAARASQVTFLDLAARASGTVAKADGAVRFTTITIHADVTIPAGGDADLMRRLVDKAAGRCLVSSSLTTPVRVEAVVHVAAARTATAA